MSGGLDAQSDAQVVVSGTLNGTPVMVPARALKHRLASGNNATTLFLSPTSYGSITSGQQGPSSWTFRLNALGLSFVQRCYLTYNITVGGTAGSAGNSYGINNYYSFFDHTETIISGGQNSAAAGTGTIFRYPESEYFQALDSVVTPAQFAILAQNIGIASTAVNGYYPPYYSGTAATALVGNTGATSGMILSAQIPLNFEFVQADVPVSCISSELTYRVFWNQSNTAFSPNATPGLLTLNNIQLYMTGLKLSDRLENLVKARIRAIPMGAPINYWRRFFTPNYTLSSGSQIVLPLLNSQGQSLCVRIYNAINSNDENRFQPLNYVLNSNGQSPIGLYSQVAGKYVLSSAASTPSQYMTTLEADRNPYSPMRYVTGCYDFANGSSISSAEKLGAWGAAFQIQPNDITLYMTPAAGTPSTATIYQLTLTDGVLFLSREGSLAVTYYES